MLRGKIIEITINEAYPFKEVYRDSFDFIAVAGVLDVNGNLVVGAGPDVPVKVKLGDTDEPKDLRFINYMELAHKADKLLVAVEKASTKYVKLYLFVGGPEKARAFPRRLTDVRITDATIAYNLNLDAFKVTLLWPIIDNRVAIASGARKDGPTKIFSAVSVAAAEVVTYDLSVPSWASALAIRLKATYNASALSGVRLSVYHSNDGIDFDTDTDDVFDHPFEAGKTRSKTYIVAVPMPYCRVEVKNLDSSYAATVDAWIMWM